MLKKSKGEKAEKPEKPAKAARVKGDKPAGSQQYFWNKWFDKSKKGGKGGYRREKALPDQPTSKEDKLKLIAALVMVLLVPIVIYLIGAFGHHGGDAAPK